MPDFPSQFFVTMANLSKIEQYSIVRIDNMFNEHVIHPPSFQRILAVALLNPKNLKNGRGSSINKDFIDEVEVVNRKIIVEAEPEMIILVKTETEGRGLNERSAAETKLIKNIL
jgi:hypothetical protein